MQMLNRDTITAVVLLFICAFSWQQVSNISKLGKFFPQVCIVILAFFSILLFFKGLKDKYDKKMFESVNLKYVRLMVVGFALYIAAIFYTGFFLASSLFLLIFGLILNSQRNGKTFLQSALISLGATTVFYLVFSKIFCVPLPIGLIFGG